VAEDRGAAPGELWDRLLAAAGALADGSDPRGLRAVLARARRWGCAVNVVDGTVFFGPYDDFSDCRWKTRAAWDADYAASLAPHEPRLRSLLAGLLQEVRG
jgi:hypothetical protein